MINDGRGKLSQSDSLLCIGNDADIMLFSKTDNYCKSINVLSSQNVQCLSTFLGTQIGVINEPLPHVY